jgi:hypothetical protein
MKLFEYYLHKIYITLHQIEYNSSNSIIPTYNQRRQLIYYFEQLPAQAIIEAKKYPYGKYIFSLIEKITF